MPRAAEHAVTATTAQSESLGPFLRWVIEQLDWEICETGDEVHVVVPEEFQPQLDGRGELEFSAGAGEGNAALPGELVGLLRQREEPLESRPAAGPQSVHEFADRLFSAYKIDGGRVHLGGCSLEDRPFVRQTFRWSDGELAHRYFDGEGHPLDHETVATFGLERLAVYDGKPPKQIDVDERLISPDDDDFLIATRVWCKYARGKLVFTIGKAQTDLPFEGWARTLAAPPFVCPHTGASSYHIAATDDGRLTAAEQIVQCDISGTRVLADDLVECAATGRRVLSEFVETCPVTGDSVLRTELLACRDCCQSVNPTAIASGRCQACRTLPSVAKDDPRIVSLLERFPGLSRWSRWHLVETSTVTLARGSTLWKQILVVVDKQTHEPLRVAERTRPFGAWKAVSSDLL